MTAIHPAPMALSVTGVTKRYASGFTLEDVTLDLPMGYIMGLIGPNGAGKSTLIKLILNMVRRDAGSIKVLTPSFTRRTSSAISASSSTPVTSWKPGPWAKSAA